jgi:rRNA maturation endonuclease Nob1
MWLTREDREFMYLLRCTECARRLEPPPPVEEPEVCDACRKKLVIGLEERKPPTNGGNSD